MPKVQFDSHVEVFAMTQNTEVVNARKGYHAPRASTRPGWGVPMRIIPERKLAVSVALKTEIQDYLDKHDRRLGFKKKHVIEQIEIRAKGDRIVGGAVVMNGGKLVPIPERLQTHLTQHLQALQICREESYAIMGRAEGSRWTPEREKELREAGEDLKGIDVERILNIKR